jgi:anti-anti-sigma factor
MPPQPFDTHVLPRTHTAVITLHRQLDAAAQDQLTFAYTEAERTNPSAILLNFTAVTSINSTGVALLVALVAQTRAANRPLLACGLSAHDREIFTITRLADFIPIFPDEASALAE